MCMGVMRRGARFYSHVNYSVTKMSGRFPTASMRFYSHVNYSVTKIIPPKNPQAVAFYSHVNYSVTKIGNDRW